MAKMLKINVQADRWPARTQGKALIGLRLSAAIKGEAVAGDLDALLPWRWQSQSWDRKFPHDQRHWVVWRIRGAAIDPVAPADFAPVLDRPALDGGFADDLSAAAEKIAGANPRMAMEDPGDGQIVGRTVFGLVDGLTAMPHPMPAALSVWTLLEIANDQDGDLYLAAPLVTVAGTYSALNPALDTTPDDEGGFTAKYQGDGAFAYATPSRPKDQGQLLAEADPWKLIDITTLGIRADADIEDAGIHKGAAVSLRDDAVELPGRLAELIDPWSHIMAVLDQGVRAWLEAGDETEQSKRRALLYKDLTEATPRGLASHLLDAVAWRRLGPQLYVSDSGVSPALSMLEYAQRQANLSQAAFAAMADIADQQAAGGSKAKPPPWFSAVAPERFAAAIELAPDLDESGTSSIEPGRRRMASLETDEGLRDWMLHHWSATPGSALVRENTRTDRALEAGAKRLALRAPRLVPGANAKLPAEDFAAGRPLLQPVPKDAERNVVVQVHVDGRAGGELTLRGRADGQPAGKPFKLKLGAGKVSLGLEGEAAVEADWGGKPLAGELSIRLAAAEAADSVELRLTLREDNTVTQAVSVALPRLKAGFDLEIEAAGREFQDVFIGATASERATVRNWLTARRDPPSALRSALALGLAGPFLPKLTAGTSTDEDLPTRLQRILPAWLDDLYAQLWLELGTLFDIDPNPQARTLGGLVKGLLAAAKADAVAQIKALFASPTEDPRTTPRAAPVVFKVDQYQGFGSKDDLWGRLAGIGVLVARSDTDQAPTEWWSLNAADLCSADDNGDLPRPLDVATHGVPTGTFTGAGEVCRVDPVPLQIASAGGVRGANIVYENRSLVAEMASEHVLEPVETGGAQPAFQASDSTRRVEAFAFPKRGRGSRLPALTFGRYYHFLPYAIGLGGVLPAFLRGDNPVTPKKAQDDKAAMLLDDLGEAKENVRYVRYRRTTPIAPPRISNRPLPGVPEDIAPLAAELPIRPPQVTLRKGLNTWFYRDPQGPGGVLAFGGGQADERLLRLDIGSLPAAGTLVISIVDPDHPLTDPCLKVRAATTDFAGKGLRLDISRAKAVLLSLGAVAYAEDDPVATPVDVFQCDPALGLWRNFAVVVTLEGADTGDIEAPVTSLGLRRFEDGPVDIPDDGASAKDAAGLQRQLPPETAHQGRTVVLLDGFEQPTGNAPSRFDLELRPPAAEFGVFERWINGKTDLTGKLAHAKLINEAFRLTTEADPKKPTNRTLDDPAVAGLRAELIEVFPERATRGGPVDLGALDFSVELAAENVRILPVRAAKKGEAVGLTAAGGAVLGAGRVYELHIRAVVPKTQTHLSDQVCRERLNPAVLAGLQAAGDLLLGPPMVLTVEVATDAMGALEDWYDKPILNFQRLMRPAPQMVDGGPGRPERQDRAIMKLAAPVARGGGGPGYPGIRYVDRMSLYCQRWSWRGRPLSDDLGEISQVLKGVQGWTEIPRDAAQVPFAGRRDDDVGAIAERRLTRGHVYAGRARIADKPGLEKAPSLFERDLDYRQGANLWRFGMKATSRYAALRPGSRDLERYTHRHPQQVAKWRAFLLTDRPTGRRLKRPGLSIVLPLTEPLMASGAVPPLLALMNETSFAGFNIGEGVEAAIDVARHPMMDAVPKFWQQWGPDPIRRGQGASGAAMGVRLDGPIGYTFDAETEAGRFDHSGWLVSPVGGKVEPWSMIRLRFRRWEEPRFLDQDPKQSPSGVVSGLDMRLALPLPDQELGAKVYRLANDGPMAAPPATPLNFNTQHEGLSLNLGTVPWFDTEAAPEGKPVKVGIAFLRAPGSMTDLAYVEVASLVEVAEGKATLKIGGSSDLGAAGTFELPISMGARVELRVVVSGREPPKQGEKKYQPAGDVSVRVRISRREGHDSLARPEEGRWLTAVCLTLLAADKDAQKFLPSEPLTVTIGAKGAPSDARIQPIRLSSFTRAVWCQFAESMSALRVNDETIPVDISDLTASFGGKVLKLGLRDGRPLTAIAPLGGTDGDAQVEEVLLAVLTVYSTDAFDRLRERPFLIAEVGHDGGLILGKDLPWSDESLWRPKQEEDDPLQWDGNGRLRFMRLLRLRDQFGVQRPRPTDLRTLVFGASPIEAPGSDLDMNPPDTWGSVLGISRPIEWTRSRVLAER